MDTITERARRHRDRKARGVLLLERVEVTEPLLRKLVWDGFIESELRNGNTHINKEHIGPAIQRMLSEYAEN